MALAASADEEFARKSVFESQDQDFLKVFAESTQQEQECKLDNYLIRNHFKRYRIYGDGNCLFRAFAYSLYNDPDKYQKIKSELYEYLYKDNRKNNYTRKLF
jgi:hypothetical protein